jgi:tetratricopeptide (TPR) repeat protein
MASLDFAAFFLNIYDMVAAKLKPMFISILAAALLLVPTRSSAEHHDTWIEILSPHFTVFSNAGEHEGRSVALQFEEIRALFQHLYPQLRVDSGKPTLVFALKNEDSLKLLIPSYGQNSKSMHIGGFYHASYDKNFAAIRTDVGGIGPLGFRSLYHEYTHAFFHCNFRGLPLWLDEGLAEYYGNTSIESKDASVGMPNEHQLRYLQSTQLLPVAQLVTIDRTSPLYNTNEHAGIFYAESWALVHYLYTSPEVRDQDLINKFLAALHVTDDPIEAAQQTFGDLKKFSGRLESYIRQGSYQYREMPLQSKLSEKDFSVRTLTPGEDVLALADYLLRSNHLPEGLERLHEVEKLDPATPGYHSEWGHYHLAKFDHANAEKELQLAVAANPNDISAHIDMAYVYLRRDGYTKESTPIIRAELERVLSLSPDFAPAHAFLSIAYAQEPDKDVNKALKSALRASELEPGNLAYFIDIGKALLAAGRIPEARKVAETAKKTATTTSDRNMATSFAKQIDYRVNHSQEAANARTPDADAAAQDVTTPESSESPAHAEGQITELLCGHPPEVILTLASGANSLLLHVADIEKISIQDGAKASDAAQSPCSKWKDRHAKVDYRALFSGIAKGEIQNISLE